MKKRISINTLFIIVLIVLLLVPVAQCILEFYCFRFFGNYIRSSSNKSVLNSLNRYLNPTYQLRKNNDRKYCETQADFISDYFKENCSVNDAENSGNRIYEAASECFSGMKCFGRVRIRILNLEKHILIDSTAEREQMIEKSEDRVNRSVLSDSYYEKDFALKEIQRRIGFDEVYYDEARNWEKMPWCFSGYDYYDGFYYYKDYFDGEEFSQADKKGSGFIERFSAEKSDMTVLYTCKPLFAGNIQAGYILISTRFTYEPVNLFEWIGQFISYLYLTLAAAVVIVIFLMKKISRPIVEFAGKTSECRILNGKIHYPELSSVKTVKELGNLAEAFDSLVNRLNENLEDMELYSHAVPHSFKNQLATIRSKTEYIESHFNDEKINDASGRILNAIRRLDEYLAELKEYNRTGLENSIETEKVSVNEFAGNIIERVRISYPDVKFEYSGLSEIENQVELNPECFEKILENLVENAASFGNCVKISVALTAADGKKIISLRVEDNGPGVPEEEAKEIFKFGYSRREPQFVKNGTGTGIGLALVRKITVNQLNGSLKVSRSKSLGGADFLVEFGI